MKYDVGLAPKQVSYLISLTTQKEILEAQLRAASTVVALSAGLPDGVVLIGIDTVNRIAIFEGLDAKPVD